MADERAVPIVGKWPPELMDLALNDVIVATYYNAYRAGVLPLQDCLILCIQTLARAKKELTSDLVNLKLTSAQSTIYLGGE